MLEQSEIAHYLLSLGVVKPRAVVEEDLTVVDASRRNCVFIATTRAGPTYVVKQAGPRSARTLEHEAAVLRVLGDATELAGHVPEVVHHDAEAARLVLRSPGGGQDWVEHHGAGRFPRVSARALGRTLAALHGLPADCAEDLPTGFDRMWALSLPEPSHERLLDMSTGAQDVVARLQASRAMCDRLRELRDASLNDDRLVHGDLRWDNCLAVAAPGSRRRTRVLLMDWELAGRGAAAIRHRDRARRVPATLGRFDPDRGASRSRPARRLRATSSVAHAARARGAYGRRIGGPARVLRRCGAWSSCQPSASSRPR